MTAGMSLPARDPLLQAAAEAWLQACGELGLDAFPAAPRQTPAPAREGGAAPAEPEDPATGSLQAVADRIAACRRCPLHQGRTRTVPGEGPARTDVMFVGEAPGAAEDASGRPFVGPAGQLLTRILEGGMGLQREEVFIANVLKCRPPGNRDPEAAETAACTPYLEEQIRLVAPALLIALGRHAANHLLQQDVALGRLRGGIHPRPGGGPPVLATYHPAYLLRNPGAKAACWEDIQLAMRFLGREIPARNPSRERR